MALDPDDPWTEYEDWLGNRNSSTTDQDELLIFGDLEPPRTSMDAFIDEMLSTVMARTHPIMGPVLQRVDGLYRHLWVLIAMKPVQQRKALRRPPYRDLSMANLLLDESDKAAPRDPLQAEKYAKLAQSISELPWPEEQGKATLIRAQAFMAQGDALRLARDWRAAELQFGAAFAVLQEIPIDLEHSLFCRKLSCLREDQGRYHEASVLQIYEMHLDCLRWRSARLSPDGIIRLAFLALKQNDPGRAMTLLTEVCHEDTEDRLSYHSQLEIAFRQAICLAALGLTEDARSLSDETLPGRRRIDRQRRLPFEWLECRIAVHLGDLDRAIPRLEAIRRWLLREHDLAKICLCSIDLALAYAKKGQTSRSLSGLLDDIASIRGAAEQPWALGSLWHFREALEHGHEPTAAARAASEIVHRREKSLTRLAAGLDPSRKRRSASPGRNGAKPRKGSRELELTIPAPLL